MNKLFAGLVAVIALWGNAALGHYFYSALFPQSENNSIKLLT